MSCGSEFFINHTHKVGENVSFQNIRSLLHEKQEIGEKKWKFISTKTFYPLSGLDPRDACTVVIRVNH